MTGFIPAPIKPEITMDHLEKIDIRVGAIERVELVPASSKLVKLTVDVSDRRRMVLASLRGERADPKAEIEGRQALFVLNLPARRLAGEISEAMLFDTGYADGLTPVPNGARAG
jgi:tRNA-binding protein